jgi:hypothetical protein
MCLAFAAAPCLSCWMCALPRCAACCVQGQPHGRQDGRQASSHRPTPLSTESQRESWSVRVSPSQSESVGAGRGGRLDSRARRSWSRYPDSIHIHDLDVQTTFMSESIRVDPSRSARPSCPSRSESIRVDPHPIRFTSMSRHAHATLLSTDPARPGRCPSVQQEHVPPKIDQSGARHGVPDLPPHSTWSPQAKGRQGTGSLPRP